MKKKARKKARKRSASKPLDLPRAAVMPQCRCLTCGAGYEHPDLYYVSLDCPACLKREGIPRWLPPHRR